MKWNKLIHFILCFNFLVPPQAVLAEGNTTTQFELNGQNLFAALFAPIPTHADFAEVFDTQDESAQLIVNNAIQSRDDLIELSHDGLLFLDKYKTHLESDFTPTNLEWAINPELAAIKFLKFTQFTRPSVVDRTLTDMEAHRMAWSEIQSRYALPANAKLDDLERQKFTDARSASALQQYQRRVYALQVMTFPQNGREPLPIETVKTIIKAKVEGLRRTNFLTAAKRAMEYHNPTFIMQRRLPDGTIEKFEASMKDWFDGVKVRFISGSITPNTSILSLKRQDMDSMDGFAQQVFQGISGTILNRSSKGDYKTHPYLYKTSTVYPFFTMQTVELTTTTGQIYRITERDWELFLTNLWLPNFDDLQQEPRDERRYIIEANERDVNLANLNLFLSEKIDANANELISRLKDRSKLTMNSKGRNALSLTDLLKEKSAELFKKSPINGLRWYGFLTHPKFWKLRDTVAIHLDKPSLRWDSQARNFTEKKYDLHKKRQKQVAKEEKNEVIRHEFRKLTKSERTAKLRTFLAKVLIITAVLAVILPKTPDATSGAAQGIQYIASAAKDFMPSWQDIFGKGNVTPASADKNDNKAKDKKKARDNELLSSMQRSAGNKDSTAESGEESKHIMTIHMAKKDDPLPTNIYLYTNDNSSRAGMRALYLKTDQNIKYDMKIATKAVFDAGSYQIPVAQVDGYTLVKLDLKINGSTVDPRIYSVNQVNGSQQTFVEQISARDGRASYDAYYQKNRFKKRFTDSKFEIMDREIIGKIGRELKTNHFQQLGEALEVLSQRSEGGPITLGQFGQTMASSGFYTYYPSESSFLIADADISDFKTFLRDDGALYYQCSGANALQIKLLQTYFYHVQRKTPSSRANIVVEYLAGYAVDGPHITSDLAHGRTVVYNRDFSENSIVLDATPVNLDPTNPPKKLSVSAFTAPAPADASKVAMPNAAILPSRPKWSERTTTETKRRAIEPLPPTPSQRRSLSPPIDYEILLQLRKEAHDAYVSSAQENQWMKREKNLNMIGLGILPASHTLLRWKINEISAEQALQELVEQNSRLQPLSPGYAAAIQAEMQKRVNQDQDGNLMAAIAQLVDEVSSNSLKTVNYANKMAEENSNSPEIDIGIGGMGLAIDALGRYLHHLEWPAKHVPKKACEDLLRYSQSLE